MKKPKKEPTKDELVRDIVASMDRIAEMQMWLIRADQRFKKGQRVRFSDRAIRRGLAERRKGKVRTGTVTAVGDLFSMDVLLDGYKTAHSFHHMFFDPVGRKPSAGAGEQASQREER